MITDQAHQAFFFKIEAVYCACSCSSSTDVVFTFMAKVCHIIWLIAKSDLDNQIIFYIKDKGNF